MDIVIKMSTIQKKVHSLILMVLFVSLIPENWLVEKRTVTLKKLHEEKKELHVLLVRLQLLMCQTLVILSEYCVSTVHQ